MAYKKISNAAKSDNDNILQTSGKVLEHGRICAGRFPSNQLEGTYSVAWVEGASRSPVGIDGMKCIWLVSIVDMTDFVRILDLSKPSASVILGPTSALLVAKVLTGSRRKKSCGRAVSMQRRLNQLNATDQHALHFQHCGAF